MKNIAYATFLQESLPIDTSFSTECFFRGTWNAIVVKPMLVGNIVIFLVQYAGGEESMALVYNEKDSWSDIGKESTRLTEAVGTAIESYYADCYSPWPALGSDDGAGDPLLN
ncbi:MAG: hypothetical protein P4L51_21430 [Puia sp.]|nr:hypothetical protein [Puia sp.]